jgi:hypothetical protein
VIEVAAVEDGVLQKNANDFRHDICVPLGWVAEESIPESVFNAHNLGVT